MNSSGLNLWIFHHYATPPTINGMDRPYDFGKNLLKYNINTTIFSSSYLHYANRNIINDNSLYKINRDTEIPFVFIKTNGYLNNGLDRVKNMLSYSKNLFKVSKELIDKYGKPDVILATSPHPFTMIAGIQIAKKYGIPCICEIRDFWPEVIFLGGKISEKSILGKILLNAEKWIYTNADSLVFLKRGDYTYLIEKKWDLDHGGSVDLNKCYYVNNGVSLELFNKQIRTEQLDDKDLKNNKFKVVYTGSIRPVNNIGKILDAAKLLIEHEDIEFLIYGEGNEVDALERRIINENILNVKMKGYIEKKNIPYVLSNSSVNILNYSQKKYNWSRGNSSNKLFEYMASGKPIISTVEMGYSIINKYDCGLEIRDAKPEDLAEAVLNIKNLTQEDYNQLGKNAKNGAQDFDFPVLSHKLAKIIQETIQNFVK